MPGNLLRRCHQIAVAIFLDECRAADLTPLQFVALTTLATEGALDKATIGGRAALDRTTVAVVAKNLWERGLVTTRPSEHDRRATLIEITDEGLALLTSVQDQVARTQERIVAPLDAAERAEFVRLLSKIAEENNLLSRAPHRLRRSATA
jgi:DNA-binding MarR family transcriptional regulator